MVGFNAAQILSAILSAHFYHVFAGCCAFCERLKEKKEKKILSPMHPNTPLVSAPVESIINEIKTVRAKLRYTRAQLKTVKRKLEKGTVPVAADVQVNQLKNK